MKCFNNAFGLVSDTKNCKNDLAAENTTSSLTYPQPGFDENPTNVVCTWTIKAPPGYQVVFFLRGLDSNRCCDFILVSQKTVWYIQKKRKIYRKFCLIYRRKLNS